MCIFTDRVEKVSSTNIFAALVDPYTQLTVYSNKVALAGARPPPLSNSPTFFNSSLFNGSQFASVGEYATAFPPGHNVFWEPESQWSAFRSDGLQVYDSQGTPVAMVLAVPLITGNAENIKMVDMSESKDFFTKLNDAMPLEVDFSMDYDSEETLMAQRKGAPMLAVKRCGP